LIVTLPVLPPVTFTEHEPDASVHLTGLGVMLPTPDFERVTVPVGDAPVTVAVHRVTEPEGTEETEQLTKVNEGDLSEITETVPEPSLVTKTSPFSES
jgi:hypothetical protein